MEGSLAHRRSQDFLWGALFSRRPQYTRWECEINHSHPAIPAKISLKWLLPPPGGVQL